MSIYSKILVVADINHDEQPALIRAIQLADKSRSRSRITFFLSIYDFSYDMTSMLSSDERDAMRRGVIQQRRACLCALLQRAREGTTRLNFGYSKTHGRSNASVLGPAVPWWPPL